MTPEQKIYPGTQQEIFIHNAPSPVEVVARALAAIRPDGTILEYDAETEEWTAVEPAAARPLERLPDDQYYDELFNLRRTIADTVVAIGDEPERTEGHIKQLAHRLTAYRHEPAFVEYTTSFLSVDDRCVLHYRDFPQGLPWNWVPQVRVGVAERNRTITGDPNLK